MQQPVGGGRKKRGGERGKIGGKEEEGREGRGKRRKGRETGREGEEGRREWERRGRGRRRETETGRGREGEREKRNVVHSTNRGVCLRATDLTIFWLVSGVASGRKASDGLTRVEQIYRKNKHKKKQKTADSNNCNFAAHQYMCTYTKRQVKVWDTVELHLLHRATLEPTNTFDVMRSISGK